MTKREFEKWKRLCYEKSEEELCGYIYIHKDCPLLSDEEKSRKSKQAFNFTQFGSKLIQEDFILIGLFGSTLIKERGLTDRAFGEERLIHRRWVESITIFRIRDWEDKIGKRESKLNWILKNI